MTTAPDTGDAPVYDWGVAPTDYVTRRQLRARDLGPNRQGVAAWLRPAKPHWKWARLYDLRKAGPKRVPTPAQLEAVAKALEEHQARAAERRGYTRAELAVETDPGPGWTDPTTDQEKNMTDTNSDLPATATDQDVDIDTIDIHDYAAHLDFMLAEGLRDAGVYTEVDQDGTAVRVGPDEEAAARVASYEERLDAHLREHRAVLGSETRWQGEYEAIDAVDAVRARVAAVFAEVDPDGITTLADPDSSPAHPVQDVPSVAPASVAPTEHGQLMTHLYAVVATNQSRERRQLIAERRARIARGGEGAPNLEASLCQALADAEARLQDTPALLGPASVAPLTDALVWHTESELAAARLSEIADSYAAVWGVQIDPAELTVAIDPTLEAVATQLYAEAAAIADREAYAVDIVSAMPLPGAAKVAVEVALSRWRAEIDPAAPGSYLSAEPARREQLGRDLAAAGLSESDHARVDFALDYLRGDTSKTDLLAAPAVVDPGQELRGRIPALLTQYTRGMSAAEVKQEISVMTVADQEKVVEVARELAARKPADMQVFPGYVDRDGVAEELYYYAIDAEEMRVSAEYLPEAIAQNVDSPEMWGISDDIGVQIPRMAARREQLLTLAREGKGLASMERAAITAVITDIDAGRILQHEQLPAPMFADERSRYEADSRRISEPAGQISTATMEAAAQILDRTQAVDPRTREGSRVKPAVSSLADTIYMVGCGSLGSGIEAERQAYVDKRATLGKVLAAAGVDEASRGEIRALVDAAAREAAEIGQGAAARHQQWPAKTAALCAARDDAIAQHQAAAAGRPRDAATRACNTRPSLDATKTQAPGRAAAGRRQLHSEEVSR